MPLDDLPDCETCCCCVKDLKFGTWLVLIYFVMYRTPTAGYMIVSPFLCANLQTISGVYMFVLSILLGIGGIAVSVGAVMVVLKMYWDCDDLFNFIPSNARNQEGEFTSRKRSSNSILYTYIKKPSHGVKVIKIEIYDTDKIKNTGEVTCDCNAEVCAQYIVKSVIMDDIYRNTKDLIEKIHNNLV